MFQSPVGQPQILGGGSMVLRSEDYAADSQAGEWSFDELRCNRTYSNKIKIEVRTQYVGPLQILMLAGVRLGDPYRFPLFASSATEQDNGSFARSIRASRAAEHSADGLSQWTVTVEYEPLDAVHWLGTSYIGQGIVCPTDRKIEIFWDAAKYRRSKPTDESETPKPYLNSLGDPLIDPPETEETRPVLKIVRNEPMYNDDYASQFKDTVNQDEFLGYPPNTVKCRDIRGEQKYDPDWGNFWIITYEFEFRDDEDGNGYDQRILNAGFRYKDGSGHVANAVDDNGQPATDAVLLNEDGTKVSPGGDPHFLTFREFPTASFADLNIPDDILMRDI